MIFAIGRLQGEIPAAEESFDGWRVFRLRKSAGRENKDRCEKRKGNFVDLHGMNPFSVNYAILLAIERFFGELGLDGLRRSVPVNRTLAVVRFVGHVAAERSVVAEDHV